jgi:hypothetical protein
MNPRETLINLFFALAITVIAQPVAQAYAGGDPLVDFLNDLGSPEQPQKAPFDQAAEACVAKVGSTTTYEKHVVFTSCLMSSKLAGQFGAMDNAYLLRMLETQKAVLAGKPFQVAKLEERTWRQNQLTNAQREYAQAEEQRRLRYAVEDIPLQQATWANTFQMLRSGNNWQPQAMPMRNTYFR